MRWSGGGIRTYLKYFYPHVLRAGWRATLVCPPGDGHRQLMDDLGEFGLEHCWVPGRRLETSFFKTLSHLNKTTPISVVHSHGLTAALCSVPFIVARRVPHMATLHDVFHARLFQGMAGHARRLALSAALSQTDRVQAVSNDAAENLAEHLPWLARRGSKVIVISNGIDTLAYRGAERRDLRSELGLSERDFLVGFLGRFMGQKGFGVLIDAMKRLADQNSSKQPVVVAVGNGGFIREDRSLIEKLGLSGSFRFLPFVPDVVATIRGLDVVAMPSYWEAGPILPMEVLSAGTPLIATTCVGLREVVNGTPAMTISPGKGDELAQAINRAIETEAEQKAAARAYSPHAWKRFDAVARAEELLKELNHLGNVAS